MRRYFVIICLLLSCLPAMAQRMEYERYDWDDNPELDTLSKSEQREGAVIILDKRIVETAFLIQTPVIYYTRHLKVRLNTDYAIESYNKVYVPMTDVLSAVDFRARFISKDGKVHDMDPKNVKRVDNYENNGPYNIYAMEGIQIGGEIEYIYTVQKTWSGFGTETYRSTYDYRRIELDIYSPDFIKYDAKTYNGLDEIAGKEYEGHGDKNVLSMRTDDVAGFDDEIYSSANASYPRVEYKFAYNSNGNGGRVNTWDDAATVFYGMIYSYTPNEKRMADLLLHKIGDNRKMETADRIRKIENYVKANFTIRIDAQGDRYEKVSGIIKSKIASNVGITRLYAALFEQAEIDIQLVMTSDRFQKKFDGDFDSWTYLQYFLLYFPATQDFLAPTDEVSRYGFIPGELCGQDGLFIRSSDIGGAEKTAVIKYIKTTSWEQNMSGMKVHITFDLNQGLASVHSEQWYSGHSASFIQPYFNYMSLQDRLEQSEDVIRQEAHDARPKNVFYTGFRGEDSLYWQPFTLKGDFTTNSYLEKTCSNYIFKIGEVIGYQYAMYNKEERNTDVTLYNPHGFHREIIFEVPAGYEVANLEALNMDYYDDSTSATMNFHSGYVRSGNTVTVTVDESYRKVTYPVAMYENFRQVMNASADFNKVVLFFEKK